MTVFEKERKKKDYYYIYYNIYNNNTLYSLKIKNCHLSSVTDLNVTMLHCYKVTKCGIREIRSQNLVNSE